MLAVQIYDEGERGDANDRKLVSSATIECVEYDVPTGIGKFELTLFQPETSAVPGVWMRTTLARFPFGGLRDWDLLAAALHSAIGNRTDPPTLARLRKIGPLQGEGRTHSEFDETGDF
jgi:hypothetical protein